MRKYPYVSRSKTHLTVEFSPLFVTILTFKQVRELIGLLEMVLGDDNERK